MEQERIKKTLMELIENIKEKPGRANAVFRADTQWVEKLRCSAQIREFPTMTLDEPPGFGGEDAGYNPVELILAALGTCQEIVYVAYAAVLGIPLKSVKINVKGYMDLKGLLSMDDSVPPGYKEIQYEAQVESSADKETIRKLVKIVETRCPVLDTLSRSISVKGHVCLNGENL